MKPFIKIICLIMMIGFMLVPKRTIAMESMISGSMIESPTSAVLIADCRGALLGDPRDENSVSWLLQKIFDYIKVLGPLAIIILSSVDFIKVIVKSDDDSFQKAKGRLKMRILLAILLFAIPSLVQLALNIFGITSDPTCGIY